MFMPYSADDQSDDDDDDDDDDDYDGWLHHEFFGSHEGEGDNLDGDLFKQSGFVSGSVRPAPLEAIPQVWAPLSSPNMAPHGACRMHEDVSFVGKWFVRHPGDIDAELERMSGGCDESLSSKELQAVAHLVEAPAQGLLWGKK